MCLTQSLFTCKYDFQSSSSFPDTFQGAGASLHPQHTAPVQDLAKYLSASLHPCPLLSKGSHLCLIVCTLAIAW